MDEAPANFEVVIVGAGFSGLLCTNYLKKAGVNSIRVFEMTPSVGGVWANGGVGSYPGAACDVPSYAYLPLLDQTRFIPTKKYYDFTDLIVLAKKKGLKIGVYPIDDHNWTDIGQIDNYFQSLKKENE